MLLVDIGNTRVKAALVEGGQAVMLPAVGTRDHAPFSAWAEAIVSRPPRVLVSNVAGPEMAMHLVRYTRERWQLEPEFALPCRTRAGMTTRYQQPEKLGVDRWLAALAAWHEARGAVCVIDVGTALTVDVVTSDGTHLGGLIAPGPDLLRLSLTRGTAQLESEGLSLVEGFADNTRDAISLGCTDALGGLLQRVATRLEQHTPRENFTWYLTGGAAPLLEALMPAPAVHLPDLVLRGLAVLAMANGS
jgi:type III pantothenate kinase